MRNLKYLSLNRNYLSGGRTESMCTFCVQHLPRRLNIMPASIADW